MRGDRHLPAQLLNCMILVRALRTYVRLSSLTLGG